MEKEVILLNSEGLHARPSALFVKEAIKFKSNILIESEGKQINAKSMISILSSGLDQGAKIKIIANGEDEKEAVDVLSGMIEGKFGEKNG